MLYTDEWSGLLHPNEIKIRDCHDDLIFRFALLCCAQWLRPRAMRSRG